MDIKKAFTKRPKGLLLIIFMLLISIPFDIYDLIFKEGEYFIIELISILYFGLTAVGLWYKNELARRSLIVVSGVLIIIHILLLLLLFNTLISEKTTLAMLGIMVLSFLFTIYCFFYLRSARLLKYYWLNDIEEQHNLGSE